MRPDASLDKKQAAKELFSRADAHRRRRHATPPLTYDATTLVRGFRDRRQHEKMAMARPRRSLVRACVRRATPARPQSAARASVGF